MKKLVFILLLCFLGYHNANAQTNDFKWRFGINAGHTQYIGDLNNDIDDELFDSYKDFRKENKDFFKDTKRKMFGIELERRINQRLGLRLGANIGQVAGSDRFTGNNQYDRNLNFQTDIVDANAVLKFSIFKRKSFINFYALSGIGVTMFDVYADLEDKNGNFYDYTTGGNVKFDDDYETNVSDLDLQKDYDQVILHIPVGLGVRVKLLPRVTASLEVESRFMFSDYLDNVSDSGAGRNLTTQTEMVAYNPNANYENEYRGNSDNKFMDSYHVVRVGLSYSFGKMKNASSTPSKRNSFNSKMRGGASKIKNAIPSRKGKFRAPAFFPSSTPSSIHTEADALIDGGKAMNQAAAEAAAEAEAKAAAANGSMNSAPASKETMALIDETLMVVDETIAVIDETVLEQEAIAAEINEMEGQILSLEEELLLTGEDESIEKDELIAEIERLEAEVDQAIAEQNAYKAEMEKAQMEALEMLEAANKEIEAIQADEVEVIETEIENVEEASEELENAAEEVKEEGKKKKKKRKTKRRTRKKILKKKLKKL